MNLHIGFDLPFKASLSCAAPDDALRVVVRSPNPTEEHLSRIEAHVQLWVTAAMYGMGAGDGTVPRTHAGALDIDQILVTRRYAPDRGGISFEASGLDCDPRYAIVLLHKLLCLASFYDPIASVNIQIPSSRSAGTPLRLVRGQHSDLPDLVQPPFACAIDLASGAESRQVEIAFARPLDAADAEVLDALLGTWLAQAAQGGYVEADFPPDGFAILASEDPEIGGSEASWSIDELSIDDRAVYALVHGLTAFGARFVPVAELSIG